MRRASAVIAGMLLAAPSCLASVRECGEPENTLPADIDAAVTAPCSEVWSADSVASSVVKTKLGSYRRLGDRYLDRMAYLFRTDHAAAFLRVTITYPDDAPRNAEIYAFSEADQSYGETCLGTGYFTGPPYPITSRLVEQTFYLHAPGQRFAVAIMTAAPERPAALAHLRVGQVDPAAPVPAPPAEALKPGRRKLGMYWEDEVFQQNFAELAVPRMTAADQAAAFRRALDRHVAYMKRIGHNLVIDPVVWYDSALYQPSAEYLTNGASGFAVARLRPPDADRWMAERYTQEGFDYWPSIRNWSLPSLAKWLKPAAEVSSGADDYVNAVDKDGTVRTRSAWHNPPVLNALHPRVQTALKNLVAEIMDRVGRYDSVRGVALWTTIHSSHGLGTVDQTFDDYTVHAFAADARIQVPPTQGEPDTRFQQWSQWLRAQHWNAWIGWRKRKQTEFYYALADTVARKKPEAKLNVMVFYPVPTMTVGLSVDDQRAYLDGIGLDLDALARHPNILITRLTLAHEYQHRLCTKTAGAAGMPELLQRSTLDFSPKWQQPFLGKTAGAVIQYTYFERNLGKSERMHPVGWRASEPGWHVTSPKAAGRNALEYLARAIALYDPQFVAYGGFQMGPQGVEEMARPLAAAFTTLPAIPFNTLAQKEGVSIRAASVEGYRWLYAVNATPDQRTVDLSFAGGPKAVILAAWDLAVFKLPAP